MCFIDQIGLLISYSLNCSESNKEGVKLSSVEIKELKEF